MPGKERKHRPRDTNELAKLVVDLATGRSEDVSPVATESAEATLGRIGGLKGGRARRDALSPERRREIALRAAKARWARKVAPNG